MKKFGSLLLVLSFIGGLLFGLTTYASELETRSYVNVPIKQNFLGVGYVYSSGDLYTNPVLPLVNTETHVNGIGLAYLRTFNMFGNSAKIDINMAHLCIEAEAYFGGRIQNFEEILLKRDVCGFGDTRVRLSYNFYGAPALTLKEFVTKKTGIVAGASLLISAPTGSYDKDHVLNTGSNLWYFKPEIGLSIPFENKWELNASFSGKYFTANDDLNSSYLRIFNAPVPLKFKPTPIYNLQLHAIYHFNRARWLALNSNFYTGGDTTINDDTTLKREGNFRFGVALHQSLNPHHSIRLHANTGVTNNKGNESDVVGMSWSYRWD